MPPFVFAIISPEIRALAKDGNLGIEPDHAEPVHSRVVRGRHFARKGDVVQRHNPGPSFRTCLNNVGIDNGMPVAPDPGHTVIKKKLQGLGTLVTLYPVWYLVGDKHVHGVAFQQPDHSIVVNEGHGVVIRTPLPLLDAANSGNGQPGSGHAFPARRQQADPASGLNGRQGRDIHCHFRLPLGNQLFQMREPFMVAVHHDHGTGQPKLAFACRRENPSQPGRLGIDRPLLQEFQFKGVAFAVPASGAVQLIASGKRADVSAEKNRLKILPRPPAATWRPCTTPVGHDHEGLQ